MASVARRGEARKARDVFLARTAAAGPAGDDDRRAITGSVIDIVSASSDGVIPIAPGPSPALALIVEGWVYRAHMLADGGRQITDILLPGDVVGTTAASRDMGHDIRACGRARVAMLRRDVVTGRDSLSLRHRWEWMRDAEARSLRSRLVSLGRRDACGRVAHFMAEMHGRLRQVGLVEDDAFTCPLTQEQLADVLGLTPVHVNRVLQRLRRDGLILFNRPRVVVPDLARLHAAGCYEGPCDVRPASLAEQFGARP